MEISSWKINTKRSHKDRIWEGLGLHLGRVWDALGRLLVALVRLLAVFWAFKIKLFLSIGPRLAPKGLLDRFRVDLERVWEGDGGIFGGFGPQKMIFGATSAPLVHSACPPCHVTFCYRNPRAASLRLVERNNAWGSSPQRDKTSSLMNLDHL